MMEKPSSIVQKLIRAETEEELFHAASAGLNRLLDADQVTVIPAAECEGGSQPWASTGSIDAPDQQALLGGLISQSYASGESCLVDDLLETRSTSTQSQPSDPVRYRSLLCVPVAEWGVLVAVASGAAAFSEDDLETIEELRTYIAAAAHRITHSDTHQGANDGIQEAAGILAHDVRNPLAIANGQLELGRKECDSEHLAKVATAHDRLEELIDDAVMLVRTSKQVGVMERVDLKAIAERAWAMVDTSVAELTIEDSGMLLADESRLCQLLENLFNNAVTHGGPEVSVRIGVLADQTGFYVADDGPGLPAEKQETIFDHGYSSDSQGTGLGLFIVERIVDAHEWTITATNSAQGGARFEITGVEVE